MEQKQHLNQVLLNLYFIFRALALLVDTSQMIKNQWELNIKNFISYEAIVLGMANIICHGWPSAYTGSLNKKQSMDTQLWKQTHTLFSAPDNKCYHYKLWESLALNH